MKIYLVGGALRDKFLNIPIKDKDYVVVGSTPEEMVNKGFKPIGKDFPVFIHPDTKDEYALARTEKKIGIGYHGFKFYASPKVNLDEDLKRRDLTINAIAQDEDGNIYDPYNGQIDIEKRILRHVSNAFIEDPLRVLRVARFSTLDEKFVIHKDTLNLLKQMVLNDELKSLAIERVIVEIKKGLEGKKPSQMFRCLCECGALNQILPGINPNKKTNSDYVELGLFIEKNIVNISPDNKFLLILLVPFFSKNFSTNKINYSENQEKNLLEHLGLSKSQKKLYESLKFEKENFDDFFSLQPKDKLDCLNRLDFFRRPDITFAIVKMLIILNTIKNKSLKSDLSSHDDIKHQDDFVKNQSTSLKKMTDLLNTIIDLSAKKKKSFDSTMDGDQIKMQIYNQRLMIFEGLEGK
ncbi:multifunctional CCA tRNA nucleotidyl transferase/2'3'-cyclic phosphodiesterase/2'nucleotidase/phosphatase [Methylophilaceae bacterium]|jgi:tRNA nucleotidyltransferase (CCA-adding enzyme)|nr:multifunctional CCA tRNA nucleotidyl transferase/2'3'-cyclic phosphodiesterase/2'nucleotidase/phosphatase [Methylophilaceae bacterium]